MRTLDLVFIFIFVAFLGLFIETTVINFPIIFFLGAASLALFKKNRIYILVFLSAFMMDSLRVSNFGYTPLFLLATISLILLYEKYSGSKDILISAIIIGTTGFIYTHTTNYSMVLTLAFYLFVVSFYVLFGILRSKKIIL